VTAPALDVLLQRAQDVPEHDAWLSEAELGAQSRLRFSRRRADWRLGRWTAKRAVAGVLGWAGGGTASLARISVVAAEDGAPEVFVDAQPSRLVLSISHRQGLAATAVGPPGLRLGCDLELIEPRSTGFLTDYLTPQELAEVEGAPDTERDLVATLVWSAKESALKALRSGLRADTRSVVVEVGGPACPPPEHGWGPLSVGEPSTSRLFPGWWRPTGDLVLTVVADEPFGPPPLLGST
jgi:4'-phosphopantetheinyl transferase